MQPGACLVIQSSPCDVATPCATAETLNRATDARLYRPVKGIMENNLEEVEGVQEAVSSSSRLHDEDVANNTDSDNQTDVRHRESDGDEDESESGEDENEEDNDDEEPKLKYARLTGHLTQVYRNGDATSCFLVAGDKMVC